MKTIEQPNYLKELNKALSYAIEEHFPFEAYFSIIPGIDSNHKDVVEIRLITQGKRSSIDHSFIIPWSDIIAPKKRDMQINKTLNEFKLKVLESIS